MNSGATPTGSETPWGVSVSGKFLAVDGQRFIIRGASYGTFAPDSDGRHFPPNNQREERAAPRQADGPMPSWSGRS